MKDLKQQLHCVHTFKRESRGRRKLVLHFEICLNNWHNSGGIIVTRRMWELLKIVRSNMERLNEALDLNTFRFL